MLDPETGWRQRDIETNVALREAHRAVIAENGKYPQYFHDFGFMGAADLVADIMDLYGLPSRGKPLADLMRTLFLRDGYAIATLATLIALTSTGRREAA